MQPISDPIIEKYYNDDEEKEKKIERIKNENNIIISMNENKKFID